MTWVRSEYAGELAVLSVWLTALLPWSVSGIRETIAGSSVTVINIRFIFFQFHYVFGISFGEQSLSNMIQLVSRVPDFVPANQQFEARIWLAAAVVFLALLLLSVAVYLREETVTDRLPVDLVRLFGAVFVLLAVTFSAVTVLFFPHQFTVPVGVIFMWVFAGALLRIERT